MDEATAALDLQTAARVSDAVLKLDGITRIVVTHALEDKILSRYDGILTMKNTGQKLKNIFYYPAASRSPSYFLLRIA